MPEIVESDIQTEVEPVSPLDDAPMPDVSLITESSAEPLAEDETVAAPSDAPVGQPQVRDPERFTGHRIQLRLFEGPLDLLLYLIRAHRYDILDIPLLEITTQFLEFVGLMEEVDLEYAGDFLVTAATLMQIKSRMLLPPTESANEDEMEEAGADPRQALVNRLLEYQKFQEAADTLKEMRDERAQMFARLVPPPDPLADADGDEDAGVLLLQDVSTFDLLRALQKVLDRVSERPVATVRREPFTIGERIRHLFSRINVAREGSTFDALCEDCETRLEVVITFLALLELIRRGRILVEQPQPFAEIRVRRSEAPQVQLGLG